MAITSVEEIVIFALPVARDVIMTHTAQNVKLVILGSFVRTRVH